MYGLFFSGIFSGIISGIFLLVDICWTAIPGFFLFQSIFLSEMQTYHISRLSGGILRMNISIDKVLSDTVANSLLYSSIFVINI